MTDSNSSNERDNFVSRAALKVINELLISGEIQGTTTVTELVLKLLHRMGNGSFPPRQSSAETECKPTLAEMVNERVRQELEGFEKAFEREKELFGSPLKTDKTSNTSSEGITILPVGTKIWASRESQGQEHHRFFSLDVQRHNSSIYLTEREYGGRTICPTMEDLRWLRDVLNQMEFCDHELDLAKPTLGKYFTCSKCNKWVTDPRQVSTQLEVVS